MYRGLLVCCAVMAMVFIRQFRYHTQTFSPEKRQACGVAICFCCCFCGGGSSSSSAAQCYKWPFGPSVAATISPETFCQEEVISLQSDTFFMHLKKTLLLLTAWLACASIAAAVLLAARVAQWFHKLLPPA